MRFSAYLAFLPYLFHWKECRYNNHLETYDNIKDNQSSGSNKALNTILHAVL